MAVPIVFPEASPFNIVEASIADHLEALAKGSITAVELVVKYLLRISTYDLRGLNLNSFTTINPKALDEARASDERRRSGLPARALEGIPYTLKDSFKYSEMTVASGSPAFQGLMSNEDAFLAARLRAAGAILLGKTNMPPMAAGGMQRGLYGRAESPYNLEYLTAAFSSGSSNGAATSTASSFAVFALGSETVSSGRSPASNNGLIAYTPSRGILSCRGMWPLYGSCDVPVPYTRSVEDMLYVLGVLTVKDSLTKGDFWRDQPYVKLSEVEISISAPSANRNSLHGKRVGVPKMYVGEHDPNAKPVYVSAAVIDLWKRAKTDLEALGAEVVLTDFPLVTNYEDDSISGQPNNVVGAPEDWNQRERGSLIAKVWDEFLIENKDPNLPCLGAARPDLIFPKPENYVPDMFFEVKNTILYSDLVEVAKSHDSKSVFDTPGMEKALPALEAQRKRDLEDWMDENGLDVIAFPANGDVGRADLEVSIESSRHALQNGVKYSNGNRAIRHLGVPTVSVPMGIAADCQMPVNLTFAGKAYDDNELLDFAFAYEQQSRRRIPPPLTPQLSTDIVSRNTRAGKLGNLYAEASVVVERVIQETGIDAGKQFIRINGARSSAAVEIFVNGSQLSKMDIEVNGDETWEAMMEVLEYECVKLPYYHGPTLASQTIVIVLLRGDDKVDARMFIV